MSTGLIALLDDVAGLAKVAAASLDDVAAAAGKAGAKAAGVVIDDAAVTPRYVTGFAASREMPIVRRIAMGSLRNKLLILLPAALALSLLAPWAITPLLMLGGAFLCYEGAEKLLETIRPHDAAAHEQAIGGAPGDAMALENAKVAGAVKTDFILSAEIMAIALSTLPDTSFPAQAAILAAVGIGITLLVYGGVAIIVKADDVGVALARQEGPARHLPAARWLGRALVTGMPPFLALLGAVGTAAMIWVGGGILIHGLEEFGFAWLAHVAHDVAAAAAALPVIGGAAAWLAGAIIAGILGVAVGAALIPLHHGVVPLLARLRR